MSRIPFTSPANQPPKRLTIAAGITIILDIISVVVAFVLPPGPLYISIILAIVIVAPPITIYAVEFNRGIPQRAYAINVVLMFVTLISACLLAEFRL